MLEQRASSSESASSVPCSTSGIRGTDVSLTSCNWIAGLQAFTRSLGLSREPLNVVVRSLVASLMPRQELHAVENNTLSCAVVPASLDTAFLQRCAGGMSRWKLEAITQRCVFLSLASGNEAVKETHLLLQIARARGCMMAQQQHNGNRECAVKFERDVVQRMRELTRLGSWHAACEVFEEANIICTDHTLGAAMEAYCSGDQWQSSLRLFQLMSRKSWTDRDVARILASMHRHLLSARRSGEDEVQSLAAAEPSWSVALRLMTTFCMERQPFLNLSDNSSSAIESNNHDRLFNTVGAVNNLLAVLGVSHRWIEALKVADKWLVLGSSPHQQLHQQQAHLRVTPNVVTFTQLMIGLRSHWAVALRTASSWLASASTGNTESISAWNTLDDVSMHMLLRLCAKGNRWQEAMQILSSSLRRKPGEEDGGGALSSLLDPQLCFRLLDMFAGRTGAAPAEFVINHALLRNSNPNCVSRALNNLIQLSKSLDEAKPYRQRLQELKHLEENESLVHVVELCAREGKWLEALNVCHLLLDDEQRRRTYIPSPKLHDWTQHALCSAAASSSSSSQRDTHSNGAVVSWEVSLGLFSRMASLHVPISEVSFQSVVRQCLSQGAASQANAVFAFVLKRGVGRK